MSDFTPEQVERAAEVLWNQAEISEAYKWGDEPFARWRDIFLAKALAVLSAAGAPEKVAPVVDEAALAEVLYDTWNFELGEHVIPYMNDRARAKLAAAVAAYLRGEGR